MMGEKPEKKSKPFSVNLTSRTINAAQLIFQKLHDGNSFFHYLPHCYLGFLEIKG